MSWLPKRIDISYHSKMWSILKCVIRTWSNGAKVCIDPVDFHTGKSSGLKSPRPLAGWHVRIRGCRAASGSSWCGRGMLSIHHTGATRRSSSGSWSRCTWSTSRTRAVRGLKHGGRAGRHVVLYWCHAQTFFNPSQLQLCFTTFLVFALHLLCLTMLQLNLHETEIWKLH